MVKSILLNLCVLVALVLSTPLLGADFSKDSAIDNVLQLRKEIQQSRDETPEKIEIALIGYGATCRPPWADSDDCKNFLARLRKNNNLQNAFFTAQKYGIKIILTTNVWSTNSR